MATIHTPGDSVPNPAPPGDDQDENGHSDSPLDPRPRAEVVGKMDSSFAVRLGWQTGFQVVSASRLKFLQDLGVDIMNDPARYAL